MTINDIQDKYLVKDSTSDEGARMAHFFYNNEKTISIHKKEKLFPLKEGLIRIVNKNLCVYLFDDLRDEDDDECIKNFLLELGMPEKNFY